MVRLKLKHLADEDRQPRNEWIDAKGASYFSRQTGRKQQKELDFQLWKAESCGPGKYYTVKKALPLVQCRSPCHALGAPARMGRRDDRAEYAENPQVDFCSNRRAPAGVKFPAVGREVVPSFTNTAEAFDYGVELPSYVGKRSPTKNVNLVNFRKQIFRDRKAPWVLLAERHNSQRDLDTLEAEAVRRKMKKVKQKDGHTGARGRVEALERMPSRSTSPAYLADLKWVGPQAKPQTASSDDERMDHGFARSQTAGRAKKERVAQEADKLKRVMDSKSMDKEWINNKFHQVLQEEMPWNAKHANAADPGDKATRKAIKRERGGNWVFRSRDRGLVPDKAHAKPDLDTLTRDWLRRNYHQLLDEEAELVANGGSPPMPVREYVADCKKACPVEPLMPPITRHTPPQALSMHLTPPRSQTVTNLADNPSRAVIKRITKMIEHETTPVCAHSLVAQARAARPASTTLGDVLALESSTAARAT